MRGLRDIWNRDFFKKKDIYYNWDDSRKFLIFDVYPAHRKLWSRFGKGRKATTHTHKEECGQRVP